MIYSNYLNYSYLYWYIVGVRGLISLIHYGGVQNKIFDTLRVSMSFLYTKTQASLGLIYKKSLH